MYRLCSNSQCSELELGLGTQHCPACQRETDVEFEPGDVVKIDPTREAQVIEKLSHHKDAGMSAVYLVGRYRSSGAYVQGVLKVAKYNSEHALEREVGHLQHLQHNNIIRLLYRGDGKTARSAIWTDTKDNQRLEFVALEHMDSGSLKDKLSNSRPVPLLEASHIIQEIGQALDYMHSKNIMHLDVKPANILFGQNGRIVLSDFGVARDQSALTELVRRRRRVGTLVYNAPELLQHNVRADHRVDIYALGLVLYEMLAGQNPVQVSSTSAGSSTQGRQVQHTIEALPPPRALNSKIPREVEQVILKATRPDFDSRYSSAAELSQALRQAVAVFQKRRQSQKKMWAGIVAASVAASVIAILVLLITVGAAGTSLLRAGRSEPPPTSPTSVANVVMDDGISLGPEATADASQVRPAQNNPTPSPPGRNSAELPPAASLAAPTSTRATVATSTPHPSQSTPRPPVGAATGINSPDMGTINLIWPENDTAQPGKSVEFRWQYIQATACDPLPDDTYFEVRFWVEGHSPEGAMNAREEQYKIYCDPNTHVRSFTIGDIKSSSVLKRFPNAEQLFWDVAIVQVEGASYSVIKSTSPHVLTIPPSG